MGPLNWPIAFVSRLKCTHLGPTRPVRIFACLGIGWSSLVGVLFFVDPTQAWRALALGSSYLLTLLVGYLALSGDIRGWKIPACLTGLLVLNQLLVKITYRLFIPGFPQRAGDEMFWVAAMQEFQTSSIVPVVAQGPGIYFIVRLLSPFFGGNYNEALIGMTILVGSIYVVPLIAVQYAMTDSGRLALVAAAISVSFDVIAYSTTIARPTIIAILLVPSLIYLFVECRKRNSIPVWLALFLLSLILLFTHPIGWVSFLVIISAVWLIFGFRTRIEKIGTVLIFGIYGLALSLGKSVLLGSSVIWTRELMSKTPLALLSENARNELLPICFLIPPLLLLIFDSVRKRYLLRLTSMIHAALPARRLLRVVSLTALGLAAVFVYAIWSKYADYIMTTYGDWPLFIALHGWKIPMAVLAMYGVILIISARRRSDGSSIALAWLLSIMGIVIFLALFLPYQGSPGLQNVDERFFEFAIFPAATFIAYGLDGLGKRMPSPVARILLMLLFSTYVVVSLMVGLRDPILFH